MPPFAFWGRFKGGRGRECWGRLVRPVTPLGKGGATVGITVLLVVVVVGGGGGGCGACSTSSGE